MNWRKKDYLDKKVDDYMNREDFDYDIASDPAYQRYKEQYTGLGKMAAEDAMGIASANTGGYGNSYAQTAAQDSYQAYVQKLNEVAPQLVTDAYNRYMAQGEKMLNDISLTQQMQDRYGTVNGGYDNGTVSTADIKAMQKYLNVDDDGLWGPVSTEAAGGLTAEEAWKKYASLINK